MPSALTVIWDRWEGIPDDERQSVIFQEAYDRVEGKEFRDRIALAVGLTMPEACESDLLPFEVFPIIRKGDPVTLDECREALIAEGASTLFDPSHPRIAFASPEEAERCISRPRRAAPRIGTRVVDQQRTSEGFAFSPRCAVS